MANQTENVAALLAQARANPGSMFASPEAVVAHPRLTRQQKIDVLRSWEYDAAEIEVAEEEGMQGPENDLLRRVLLALADLTRSPDAGSVAPTKQHGLL